MKSTQEARQVGIEGVETLIWRKTDSGAFGNTRDGPLFDWIEGKDKFIAHVKNFDVVVQAGGCCGMYPRFYKNYFKQVYTFEPHPDNFACLDVNCVGEGYHKYNMALGAGLAENVALSRGYDHNVGMYQIDEISTGDVAMCTVDSLNLERCDLIHLDIEGYEGKALLGASNTIQKFKPVIIVERNSGASYLESLGYRKVDTTRMDSIFII